MWFGTQDGLNRYDGYEFKKYFHQKNDSNSLGENYVRDIVEDKKGNLWICTYSGGVSIYRQDKNAFSLLKQKNNDVNSLVDNRTVCILYSSKDEVWIGTEHGLSIYKPNKKQFANYFNKRLKKQEDCWITALCEDANGTVWASTFDGKLLHFTSSSKWPTVYSVKEIDKKIHTINALCSDKNGVIWLGTDQGLYYLAKAEDNQNTSFLHLDIFKSNGNNNKNITVLKNKTSDVLWVGTESHGLIEVKLKDKTITEHINNPKDPSSISSNFIYSIYCDENKNIWIGTEIGLSTHFNLREKLSSFTKDNYYTQQNIGVVWAVFCEDSMAIIGTSKSLFTLNRNTGRLNKIKGYGAEIDKNYYCLCKYQNGFLVGTSDGIVSLQKGNNTYQICKLTDAAISTLVNKKVCNIAPYDDDNFWIGTYETGLFRWNTKQHSLKKYESNTNKYSLSSEVINTIFKDKSGIFWFGTDNGFSKYLPLVDGFENHLPSETNENTINKQYVYSFYDDGQHLWIGTYGGGLNCWNKKQNKFTFYTTEQGLCNNDVYCIEGDNKNNIWLSTNNGISCFNLVSKAFSNYFESDGAQGNEFDHWAGYKNKKNEIIFGGNNGITFINPDQIKGDTIIPKVVITDLRVMDKPFGSDMHLSDLKKITLSYNENRVAFSFAALSFTNSGKNKYKFMMKGLDTCYCSPTEQHSILYNNLTPGEYVFMVVGCNSDGVWNNNPAQIVILVDPPYYATWWFKMIIASIILSIFYLIYKYRINQILALQIVRNRIAQDLHDDIGATLGSIKVFSEVAKKRIENNPQKVEEVLDKIAEASHEMIDKMSDIVWSVNPINDSNEELLNRMKSYAAIMLTSKNIDYFFDTKLLTEHIKLNMLQRKNIYLIFKEAIHNSIKYANCTHIDILFYKELGKLRMEIKDNGKGFNPNYINAFNGNGLKNIKSRAIEIGAVLALISKENEGTKIILEIN